MTIIYYLLKMVMFILYYLYPNTRYVATIMGLDRAIRCGNNTGASVYDDRGILFI